MINNKSNRTYEKLVEDIHGLATEKGELSKRIAELEAENARLIFQATAAQLDFKLSEQHVQLLQRENDEMAQELGAIESDEEPDEDMTECDSCHKSLHFRDANFVQQPNAQSAMNARLAIINRENEYESTYCKIC